MKSVSRTVLLSICFSLLWSIAEAASGPVIFNVDVPAGGWKGVRLKHLPKGTLVGVEVESSGDIIVAFVGAKDYRQFPNIPRPLFLGRVDKRLSFSIAIPAKDHYFLVFDNRSGRQTCAVKATVGATSAGATPIEAADKILREFERQLHHLFVFDAFPVRVERCGMPKAFADTAGIVLCAEYIRPLYDAVEERQKAVDALSFTIFHQVGRILLAQWKHPSFDKQKTAAEFAAVLLVMLNKKERIGAMAEYFVANPSASKSIAKLFPKNRHPLSVQRAREIVRWLKDPHLARKWQKTFIPHMQTALLEKLQKKPTEWTDLDLVNKELAARRGVVPKSGKGLDL
jgi:hypothetical protein